MTHTRSRRDARYTAQKYEETLSDLILCEKVNLCDIPFEVRKLTRSLYIYGNRISRYDIEKKIAFFVLFLRTTVNCWFVNATFLKIL